MERKLGKTTTEGLIWMPQAMTGPTTLLPLFSCHSLTHGELIAYALAIIQYMLLLPISQIEAHVLHLLVSWAFMAPYSWLFLAPLRLIFSYLAQRLTTHELSLVQG